MKKNIRNLEDITGDEISKTQARLIRGGDDPEPLWVGECAVHHADKSFWKLITWRWEGTGLEAEMACTAHYDTNEETGSYCFCNYYEQ